MIFRVILVTCSLFSSFLQWGNLVFANCFKQNEICLDQRLSAAKYEQSDQETIDAEACVQVRQAKIAVLNKITAKREVIVLSSDSEFCIGFLTIKVLECWKMLDPLRSDNLIFVEIYEGKKNKKQSLIFRGWISQAHPGYATLEHYSYALAVIECF
jgi:hypothetical protein